MYNLDMLIDRPIETGPQQPHVVAKKTSIKVGDQLGILVKNISNNDFKPEYQEQISVDKIATGGFYGAVIIPQDQDFVIKTTQPDDLKHLLRLLNWELNPFPPQVNEMAAKLDHLSTRLIHQSVPALSGAYYAPDSFGYTGLDSGYAQLIEKISGRPPIYNSGENELARFKIAQRSLKELGYSLGLEHAAQIHEDNPFGLANIWWDLKRNCLVWMDTLPAMPHKPVFGLFPFKFHDDVRLYFQGSDFKSLPPTFNRIHTDMFKSRIEQDRSVFYREDYKAIMENLEKYDELVHQFDAQYHPKKQFAQLLKYGVSVGLKGMAAAGVETAKKIVKSPIDAILLTFCNGARKELALSAIREAAKYNLATEDEVASAEAVFASAPASFANRIKSSFPLTYPVIGLIATAGMGSAAIWLEQNGIMFTNGLSSKSVLEAALLIGTRFLVSNGIKGGSSEVLGKMFDTNYRAAFITSLIPIIGDYLSFTGHLVSNSTTKNPNILHYTVRNALAKTTEIIPSGGIGSDAEAKLYHLLGPKLEEIFNSQKLV